MPLKILILEDEADYRDSLRDILNQEGFSVDGVGSLSSYRAWQKTHALDVLLLDRKLPDGDGLSILGELRKEQPNLFVIILSARDSVQDKIMGLNADADYYLTKPVIIEELIALLSRIDRNQQHKVRFNRAWKLDTTNLRLITPSQDSVVLSRKECAFLGVFLGKQDAVVDKHTIVEAMGENLAGYDMRRMEILVRRLRAKVKDKLNQELPISTVYGVGYLFKCCLESVR